MVRVGKENVPVISAEGIKGGVAGIMGRFKIDDHFRLLCKKAKSVKLGGRYFIAPA